MIKALLLLFSPQGFHSLVLQLTELEKSHPSQLAFIFSVSPRSLAPLPSISCARHAVLASQACDPFQLPPQPTCLSHPLCCLFATCPGPTQRAAVA